MVRFKPPGSSTWYNVSSDAGARAATAIEAAKKAATSKSSSYRGPTEAQIKAGTLAATPATPAHRESARTTALTQSGIRTGQTPAQAVAEATRTVYGASSAQARSAQAILDKQKADIAIGVIKTIKDLPKSPHDIPLTPAQIHRREKLFEDAKSETLFEALKGKSGEITKYQVIPTEKKARRAYLDLQTAESKLQTNEAQLYLAEQRLVKWDKYIKDGAFVGSEAQYNKYVQNFNSYSKVSNRYDKTYTTYDAAFNKADTTGKQLEQYQSDAHRAKFGGLMGKYEDAETKAAERIAAESEKFRESHPLTAQRIDDVAAFIKETSELQVVGPAPSGFGTVTKAADPMVTGLQLDEQSLDAIVQLQQREFASGMIQQAGKKPVKTAAMVGVGLITPPVLKGVSTVAKTLGAGRTAAIAGRGVLYGMGGMYVVGTGIQYTQAGTPREKGAVLGEAIFQEIVPLFAGGYIGTKAITVAPKVSRAITTQAKKISEIPLKEFNKQMRAIEIMQDLGMTTVKGQRLKTGTKTAKGVEVETLTVKQVKKSKIQRQIESAISRREAQLKRPLLESEVKEIKRFYEMKIPKTQQEVIVELKAEAMNKRIDDIVNFKNQHMRIYEIGKQDPTIKQMLRSVSTGQKPSVYEPILKQKIKTIAQAQSAKQELKSLLNNKTITKAEYQRLLKIVSKQEALIASKLKVKTVTTSAFMQQLSSVAAISAAFKEMQVVKPKTELKTKQEAIPKAKALPKLKTRARAATTPKQKAAEKAAATRKAVERAKKARVVKAKAKPKEFVKPIFPSLFPSTRKPTKKKTIKKKVGVITLNQKNLNAVATFRQVLGGL